MVVVESPVPKQFEIWGPGVFVPSREIIKVEAEAGAVVSSIFNAHNIKKFSYTKFIPESTYPMDTDQPYWWSDWSGEPVIEKLSQQIYEGTTCFEMEFEGNKIVICEILGIGSRVETEGGIIRHMRMLDFDSEASGVDVRDIGLPRGVVLRTDRSYHYYGLDLVTEDGWRSWVKNLIKVEKSEELFGADYLPMCLERGFSALRVFGYEGTPKEKTPVVVARI